MTVKRLVDPETLHLVQYYLVDATLNMRKGKIAAQCAHGALYMAENMRFQSHGAAGLYAIWYEKDMKKIVLKAKPEELQKALDEIPYCVEVRDKGYTEVAPDTRTVVVIPPSDKDSQIPQWVKDLPLL